MSNNKIIYSINIKDIQNVAEQELSRKLTKAELKIIEDKIGDHFDWYDSIISCIHIKHTREITLQSPPIL